MSYGLIYTIPFASLEEVSYIVKIEKEGYDGESTELVAGANPFVVEISNEEFLYTPSRFSTATIEVVGSDYLRTLFSTDYRQFRVTLERNGVAEWCGYIKPELYTQDYSSNLFSLEIECMSAMSVLEYLDYTINAEEKSFVSLWYLLKRCIGESGGNYASVYIPHVYASGASQYESGENVFEKMLISEQDFFDEDGKPMKLKEVLEEICKFLNWTCVDWKGELYFVDIDHEGIYNKYDLSLAAKEEASVNSQIVQDIGFAGSSHSLDILPGYNRVTVKCSNYPVGELLHDEDYNDLESLLTIDSFTDDNKKACRSVFLQPKIWNCLLFKNGEVIDNNGLSEIKDEIPHLDGVTLMKYCVYEQEKKDDGTFTPKITDYNFIDVIRLRYPLSGTPNEFRPGWYKVMEFRGASATYSNGAIGIKGEVKIIKDNDLLPWGNSAAGYGKDLLGCQIRIGNNYYGNRFGDKSSKYTWNEDPDSFITLSTESWNNDGSLDWVAIPNDKTLDMPYNGLSGFIIPIEQYIYGDFEFSLLSRNRVGNGQRGDMSGELIRNFSVTYQKEDNSIKESNDSDRIYENVLNENYINELDEIELKISSYNDDGACYSKVLLDGNYLTDNLYNSILRKNKRPEELLITRIINHYSDTRIKLTQIVKNSKEISPLTILTDNFLVSKRFINAGGSIDYAADRFECIMIEK